ncbi:MULTISPECIES: hypothetical protein [Prevotella]|nr:MULTISPECIES: hypothetical protein [Prevotella]
MNFFLTSGVTLLVVLSCQPVVQQGEEQQADERGNDEARARSACCDSSME